MKSISSIIPFLVNPTRNLRGQVFKWSNHEFKFRCYCGTNIFPVFGFLETVEYPLPTKAWPCFKTFFLRRFKFIYSWKLLKPMFIVFKPSTYQVQVTDDLNPMGKSDFHSVKFGLAKHILLMWIWCKIELNKTSQ